MTKLFADAALLPTGLSQSVSIDIDGGRIRRVTRDSDGSGADERHAFIMPGTANLHSHAFQRAMSGLTERRGPGADSFWSWRTAMYKFALSMTPDDLEAVAAQLYVEMLEAGYTRVGEFHYLHHDENGQPYSNVAEMAERIGAASRAAGIALTLLPVFYAHSGFGPKPPTEGQRRFITDRDSFAALLSAAASVVRRIPGAVLGVAPHSLRAATLEEIRDAAALPHDGPVHIHVAEQTLEVEDCVAATGARPIELLLSGVDVTDQWCLIHATHLSDSELNGVAAAKAVAGLCPITEANLGDGIFRAADFTAAGGRFGLGSDSNVQISLAGELRQLEYSQRLAQRARNVLAPAGRSTGEALLLAAASGGAQALGAGGAIVEGMVADLVSLDSSHARYMPGESLLDSFVFGSDIAIRDVWVAGRKQVSDGKHHGRDAIRAQFERTMDRLVHA